MTRTKRNTEQTKRNHLKTIHLNKESSLDTYPYISGQKQLEHSQSLLRGNIENFIGYAQVPIGLAGPLLINGDYAKGEYRIPMATQACHQVYHLCEFKCFKLRTFLDNKSLFL